MYAHYSSHHNNYTQNENQLSAGGFMDWEGPNDFNGQQQMMMMEGNNHFGQNYRCEEPSGKAPRAHVTKRANPKEEYIKQLPNPYMLFTQKHRPLVCVENPGMRPGEITKILGATWKSMTEDEKFPYQEEYRLRRIAFTEMYPRYKRETKRKRQERIRALVPNAVAEVLKEVRQIPKEKVAKPTFYYEDVGSSTSTSSSSSEELEYRQIQEMPRRNAYSQFECARPEVIEKPVKLAEPVKPIEKIKRPMNAFMCFANSKRIQLGDQLIEMKQPEQVKLFAALWNTATDAQKKPFYEEAKRLKAEFVKAHPDYIYRPKQKTNEKYDFKPTVSSTTVSSTTVPPKKEFVELEDITPTFKVCDRFPWKLAMESIGIDFFEF